MSKTNEAAESKPKLSLGSGRYEPENAFESKLCYVCMFQIQMIGPYSVITIKC